MKKFVLLHGLGFWYNECFGPSLIKTIKDMGAEYKAAEFPLINSGKLSFDSWKKGMDNLVKDFKLDDNTVVIAHSLSTFFILKYLKLTNSTINTLITISGAKLDISSYTGQAENDILKVPGLIEFMNTQDEYNYVKQNVKNKIAIYSNGDQYFSIEMLQAYADALDTKKMFLKDRGHFGRTAANNGIPELNELVKNIIS